MPNPTESLFLAALLLAAFPAPAAAQCPGCEPGARDVLPRHVSDPVLVGDAFRVDGAIHTVARVDGGDVTFRDAPGAPHSMEALFGGDSGAERLVHRPARPVYYIAGVTAGIAGAVALFRRFHREVADDEWHSLVEDPPLLSLTALGAGASFAAGVVLGRMLGAEKDEWRSLESADRPTWTLSPGLVDGSVSVTIRLRR